MCVTDASHGSERASFCICNTHIQRCSLTFMTCICNTHIQRCSLTSMTCICNTHIQRCSLTFMTLYWNFNIYISPWMGFEFAILVVVGTNCAGSCKSNYHTIMTKHVWTGYYKQNGFSLGLPVSSTNKTDRHDITEILLKVALNTTNQPTIIRVWFCKTFFKYWFVMPDSIPTYDQTRLNRLLQTKWASIRHYKPN
jgi:hypothetical protein